MAFRTLMVRGRLPLLVLFLLVACLGYVAGDTTPAQRVELPKAFEKVVPESPEDLLAIQSHVRKVLEKVIPCTVGLRIGQAQGSGVIINKEGHVLTAAHVSGPAGRPVEILLHDGRKLKGKTLGANHGIDSGLVQITDKGEWPFCEMGKSGELVKGNWCIAIGHPGGVQPNRAPVVRVGRILDQLIDKNRGVIRTDCALVGGDSGGPLFDMHGRVIGINSRINGPLTANLHVPVDTFHDTWDRLAKSEVWGNTLFPKASDAYLGIQADPNAKNCRVASVSPDSPAEKAGLKANDIITMFGKKKIATGNDLFEALSTMKPGLEVAVQVLRGEESLSLKLTLGKRPGSKKGKGN